MGAPLLAKFSRMACCPDNHQGGSCNCDAGCESALASLLCSAECSRAAPLSVDDASLWTLDNELIDFSAAADNCQNKPHARLQDTKSECVQNSEGCCNFTTSHACGERGEEACCSKIEAYCGAATADNAGCCDGKQDATSDHIERKSCQDVRTNACGTRLQSCRNASNYDECSAEADDSCQEVQGDCCKGENEEFKSCCEDETSGPSKDFCHSKEMSDETALSRKSCESAKTDCCRGQSTSSATDRASSPVAARKSACCGGGTLAISINDNADQKTFDSCKGSNRDCCKFGKSDRYSNTENVCRDDTSDDCCENNTNIVSNCCAAKNTDNQIKDTCCASSDTYYGMKGISAIKSNCCPARPVNSSSNGIKTNCCEPKADDVDCCGSKSVAMARDTAKVSGRQTSGDDAHHHHELRMRLSKPRRACDYHVAKVAGLRQSMKKGQVKQEDAITAPSSLTYLEKCLCRAMDRLIATTSNPYLSKVISTWSCCDVKKTAKVESICCTKTHAVRSRKGTYRRLNSSGGDVSNATVLDNKIVKELSHRIQKFKPASDDLLVTEPAHATQESRLDDLEKGRTSRMRLSLSVLGMTCSSCIAKLDQSLLKIPGVAVESIKSSFVLNRTELLYDPTVLTDGSAAVIRLIKKQTGFLATIIDEVIDTGHGVCPVLHLRLTEEARLRIVGLDGVYDVSAIIYAKKPPKDDTAGLSKLYAISYDAEIIGARDLITKAGNGASVPSPDENLHEQAEALATERAAQHLRNAALTTVFCAALTIPVIVLAFGDFGLDRKTVLATTFALATVAQFASYEMYRDALKSLLYHRELDMNCLVIISTTTAYVYSVVAMALELHYQSTKSNQITIPKAFFETSTLLITLIFLGRVITIFVRLRAAHVGSSIGSLQESSALLFSKAQDDQLPIDTRLLQYHDVLVAEAGNRIATDGIVVDGTAEIDESLLTGEPVPALRKIKSPVLAGSTMVTGSIRYRVTRLIHENSISTTKRLITSAASSKSRTQDLSDRVSAFLIPAVLGISLIVFIIWTLTSKYTRHDSSGASAAEGLTYMIAVLAVSCPCAIVLAVPMVLVTGASVGMKAGIIFRSANAVEYGARIKHAVFDKTGTLTLGRMAVHSTAFGCVDVQQTRGIVALLTRGNRHPVSVAVHEAVRQIEPLTSVSIVGEVEAIIGKGLAATINGMIVKGGSPAWFTEAVSKHVLVQEVLKHSLTPFVVAQHNEHSPDEQELVAVFGLTDTVRPEVQTILTFLAGHNIQPHLLSGDQPTVVDRIGKELGFPASNVRAACSPEFKADYISQLQNINVRRSWLAPRNKHGDRVLFIGDGSNDAVALTQADVGISMSRATDVAAGAADVGILSDNLLGVPAFITLSRRMMRCVWFNMLWSITYNVWAVLLAGGALEAAGVRIEPRYAGLGELVSVLPVIVASVVLVRLSGRHLSHV